ncbi:MAG: magnesium/cobalt transporter CorA [Candidatus Eremiobacteraeota bacterium]|nr:magnesium/cobalt transporter CorA [Candidatus Eremiobacteraeota bacterium]
MKRLKGKKTRKLMGAKEAQKSPQGTEASSPLKITIIDYDEQHLEIRETHAIEDAFPYSDTSTVTWINVDAINNAEVLEKLGKHFAIHPLIIEDISNPTERAKVEDFDEYLYLVLKMLSPGSEGEIVQEQVSIVVGSKFVITFQEEEKSGDVFQPIREKIKACKGRIRKMGPDYLAYSLVDAIVDNYFVILEKTGDHIEDLEEKLMLKPSPATLQGIHILKREMIFLHRSVWPLREVISRLQRGESALIQETTRTYLRDVYDHTIQVIETVETYRDMISGMLDTYLSSISYKTNEIMKVLTIMSTIFIPLTFFAGVYGMNFRHFPELEWHHGLLLFWIVNCIVAGSMLIYFRRKRWI